MSGHARAAPNAQAKNSTNRLAVDAVLDPTGPPKRHRLLKKCKGFHSLGSVCCAPSALTGSNKSDIANLEELGDHEDWTQGSKVSSTKWPCTICLAEVPMKSKRHHIATRHPGVPVNLFQAEKPMAVAFSKELPDDQTDLGNAIASSARAARKRAKRQHLLDFHPRYKGNLQQYLALTLKGKPKGLSRSL